jgi:hypothetical protein
MATQPLVTSLDLRGGNLLRPAFSKGSGIVG